MTVSIASLADAKAILENAIAVGIPMFNGGDHTGTTRVYMDAAEAVVTQVGLVDSVVAAASM